MEPASLGAAQHYKIAKQALSPENLKTGVKTPGSETKASPVAQGLQEFSKVFETVEETTQAFSTGQGNAHAVVEALATAEVALETAVTIRNRVVEAYQELLRMPV